MSARISSAYICTLLQSAKEAASEAPDGEITVGQTPYFDLSNDQELGSLLAALLEDEVKRMKEPVLDSDLDF